jgi:hypothetical protein
MRLHIIAGHYGPSDRPGVTRARGVTVTKVDLVSSDRRLGHGIDDAIEHLKSVGIYPSEIGLDLLVLAALVTAADTRISRGSESQDTWTREIQVIVPVSDPARWHAIGPLLQRTLNFLSGDIWEFQFRSRPATFATVIPARAADAPVIRFDSLSLFSGGLDSLIGAIDLLANGSTPLLISHAGEGATSGAQKNCLEGLKESYPNQAFDQFRVWMNFPEGTVRNVESEKSTRARSFLFFALGVLAGSGLDRRFTLRVPENGLIALNVPLDTTRLGALSTRTTHPFYMARWNDIIAALGIDGEVKNPYWDQTKGEMVRRCANQTLLKDLSGKSLSCASPTKGRWQGLPTQHCGYCLPCLIRRASLATAWGPNQDPTIYSSGNLQNKSLDPTQAEGRQIRAFQFAVSRLRSSPGIEKLLIHKPGSLADVTQNLASLADVYRRGMEEVDRVLTGVRTRNN